MGIKVDNRPINRIKVTAVKPVLAITTVPASPGVTVYAKHGGTTLTGTTDATGYTEITVNSFGTWEVVASRNGKTVTETVEVKSVLLYPVTILLVKMAETLNDNSWEAISAASAMGTAKDLWQVGDTKIIHLQGTIGTLQIDTDLNVFILAFDHNLETEGPGVTFGCFKTLDGIDVCLTDSLYGSTDSSGAKLFNANHWGNSNRGGWSGRDDRYDILGSTNIPPSGYGASAAAGRTGYDAPEDTPLNPVPNTLMAALPSDLRAVMLPITKYTDNLGFSSNIAANVTVTVDYLPYPSEFEVLGGKTNANQYEQRLQRQYNYYLNGNSTVKRALSNPNGIGVDLHLRSPRAISNSTFSAVNGMGAANRVEANKSAGMCPIFKV